MIPTGLVSYLNNNIPGAKWVEDDKTAMHVAYQYFIYCAVSLLNTSNAFFTTWNVIQYRLQAKALWNVTGLIVNFLPVLLSKAFRS